MLLELMLGCWLATGTRESSISHKVEHLQGNVKSWVEGDVLISAAKWDFVETGRSFATAYWIRESATPNSGGGSTLQIAVELGPILPDTTRGPKVGTGSFIPAQLATPSVSSSPARLITEQPLGGTGGDAFILQSDTTFTPSGESTPTSERGPSKSHTVERLFHGATQLNETVIDFVAIPCK